MSYEAHGVLAQIRKEQGSTIAKFIGMMIIQPETKSILLTQDQVDILTDWIDVNKHENIRGLQITELAARVATWLNSLAV